MKKIYDVFGNEKVLKLIFSLFFAVYLLFDVIQLFTSSWAVANSDRYKDMFVNFMNLGYYESVAQGTSILYNVALRGLYYFTHSVDASFFILNASSDLALLFLGCWFCWKIGGRNKYFYIIAACYAFKVLSIKSYLRASNDSFLGVFIIILLYLLIYKLYDRRKEWATFAGIGLLFGICLAIRITAVLLLPIIGVAVIYWIKNTQITPFLRMKLIALLVLMMAGSTVAFHFPSLIEKQQISFEDKSPSPEVNWVQRNYLGLKKIEDGSQKMHRDAIWKYTTFEEVAAYLKLNGKESIPDTLTEVAAQHPMLIVKMTAYNLIVILAEFLRFWVFLFILPMAWLIKGSIFEKGKLPIVLFLTFLVSISIICFSFIETRWFIGYEVLIPVAALLYFDPVRFSNINKANAYIVLTLVLITLVNLKTVVSKVASL